MPPKQRNTKRQRKEVEGSETGSTADLESSGSQSGSLSETSSLSLNDSAAELFDDEVGTSRGGRGRGRAVGAKRPRKETPPKKTRKAAAAEGQTASGELKPDKVVAGADPGTRVSAKVQEVILDTAVQCAAHALKYHAQRQWVMAMEERKRRMRLRGPRMNRLHPIPPPPLPPLPADEEPDESPFRALLAEVGKVTVEENESDEAVQGADNQSDRESENEDKDKDDEKTKHALGDGGDDDAMPLKPVELHFELRCVTRHILRECARAAERATSNDPPVFDGVVLNDPLRASIEMLTFLVDMMRYPELTRPGESESTNSDVSALMFLSCNHSKWAGCRQAERGGITNYLLRTGRTRVQLENGSTAAVFRALAINPMTADCQDDCDCDEVHLRLATLCNMTKSVWSSKSPLTVRPVLPPSLQAMYDVGGALAKGRAALMGILGRELLSTTKIAVKRVQTALRDWKASESVTLKALEAKRWSPTWAAEALSAFDAQGTPADPPVELPTSSVYYVVTLRLNSLQKNSMVRVWMDNFIMLVKLHNIAVANACAGGKLNKCRASSLLMLDGYNTELKALGADVAASHQHPVVVPGSEETHANYYAAGTEDHYYLSDMALDKAPLRGAIEYAARLAQLSVEDDSVSAPATVHATLKPHQLQNLAWMYRREQEGTLEHLELPVMSLVRAPDGSYSEQVAATVFYAAATLSIVAVPPPSSTTQFEYLRLRKRIRGGLLCDDVGLGKTLSLLSVCAADLEDQSGDGDSPQPALVDLVKRSCGAGARHDIQLVSAHLPRTTLIVVPLSIVGQWIEEIQRFLPKATFVLFYGAARHRYTLSDFARADFVITTYETLSKELREEFVFDDFRGYQHGLDRILTKQCAVARQARWERCSSYRMALRVDAALRPGGEPESTCSITSLPAKTKPSAAATDWTVETVVTDRAISDTFTSGEGASFTFVHFQGQLPENNAKSKASQDFNMRFVQRYGGSAMMMDVLDGLLAGDGARTTEETTAFVYMMAFPPADAAVRERAMACITVHQVLESTFASSALWKRYVAVLKKTDFVTSEVPISLRNALFRRVILDEFQKASNVELGDLSAERLWAVSGTPINNNEFSSLTRALALVGLRRAIIPPGCWRSEEDFRLMRMVSSQNDFRGRCIEAANAGRVGQRVNEGPNTIRDACLCGKCVKPFLVEAGRTPGHTFACTIRERDRAYNECPSVIVDILAQFVMRHERNEEIRAALALEPVEHHSLPVALSPHEWALYEQSATLLSNAVARLHRQGLIGGRFASVMQWAQGLCRLCLHPARVGDFAALNATTTHLQVENRVLDVFAQAERNEQHLLQTFVRAPPQDVLQWAKAKVRVPGPVLTQDVSEALVEMQKVPPVVPSCGVCMDDMLDPTLLGCLHMFCKECIISIVHASPYRPKCPYCRDPNSMTAEKRVAELDFHDTAGEQLLVEESRTLEHVADEAVDNEAHLAAIGMGTRCAAVVALLQRIWAEQKDEGVLIFTKFLPMARLLGEAITAAGYQVPILDGSTTFAQRRKIISGLQRVVTGAEAAARCLIVTSRTANAGINLTFANHVVFVEPNMNPAMEIQAVGRVHRFGQARRVHVHHMYAPRTIEEVLYARSRNLIARMEAPAPVQAGGTEEQQQQQRPEGEIQAQAQLAQAQLGRVAPNEITMLLQFPIILPEA